jgi:alkyl hydroperoxide reductase subunit AhpC
MTMVGQKAPVWTATAYHNGEKKTLSSTELAGQWYVIYWWPFDFTGICNSEVIGFQELASEFESNDVVLIGASCDSFHSHRNWVASDDFPEPITHPLIADNTHRLTTDFGFYFEAVGCALRGTVLVNPDGVVMSTGCNFLPVAREPKDVLTTAIAFKSGACSLPKRREF